MSKIQKYLLNLKMKILFRKRRWLNFAYSSVFPHDEPLSAWISILALMTNELIIVNRNIVNQFTVIRSNGTAEVPYYLWLACSHYREAAKFLGQSMKTPKIEQFIQSLPDSIQQTYSEVKATYEPYKGSFVDLAVKPIRDSFFHYNEITSPLWTPLWRELEDERGEFSMKGGGLDFTRWEFAENIRINMIQKSLEESGFSIEQVIESLGTATVNMVAFGQNVVTEYFSRVESGELANGRAQKTQKKT